MSIIVINKARLDLFVRSQILSFESAVCEMLVICPFGSRLLFCELSSVPV